jgi:hypothetical protein
MRVVVRKNSGWDFWGLFFLDYGVVFVEMMVYLLYENVMFWSMDALVLHYSEGRAHRQRGDLILILFLLEGGVGSNLQEKLET